jgi:hypothetical protein
VKHFRVESVSPLIFRVTDCSVLGVMNGFQKVLVVDDGARSTDHALSAELAELGYASVTASVEATDDVLDLVPSPAAIVLQLPRRTSGTDHASFVELASRLKDKVQAAGIPIIWFDPSAPAGGFASAVRSRIGSRVLNEPEL